MKRILLTAALLLGSTCLFAQIDLSELKYGVRAGLGIGSIDSHFKDDLQTMGGFAFSAGVFAELPVWKALRVTAELNYEHASISDETKSMQMVGTGLAGATVFTETQTDFPVNFIHIPVLAKVCFIRNDLMYFEAGPQLDFLVGKVNSHSEIVTTVKPNVGASTVTRVKNDSDDTDNFKKAHVSIALGWGFNFLQHFSVGVRGGIGLGDLQAEKVKQKDLRVSHTDLQLALRYSF